MDAAIAIVVMMFGGLVAALMAGSRNRSVFGWFFGGALLPLVAIMILAVSAKLPPPEY